MRKSPAANGSLGCLYGAREWRPAETEQPAKRVAPAIALYVFISSTNAAKISSSQLMVWPSRHDQVP